MLWRSAFIIKDISWGDIIEVPSQEEISSTKGQSTLSRTLLANKKTNLNGKLIFLKIPIPLRSYKCKILISCATVSLTHTSLTHRLEKS